MWAHAQACLRAASSLYPLLTVHCMQVVGILVWAGFFSGMVLLWWEFGWKLADVSHRPFRHWSKCLPACALADPTLFSLITHASHVPGVHSRRAHLRMLLPGGQLAKPSTPCRLHIAQQHRMVAALVASSSESRV